MHLSAKQFAQIVERLGADVIDPNFAGDDKRRAHRVELKHRVTIIPHDDGRPAEGVGVELRDFSPRGIRFLHSQAMRNGTQFVLQLPQTTGDPISILCTVAHSESTPEGPVATGAEFTCVLKPATKSTRPVSGLEQINEQDRIRHSILK
jgi:hypothetical protein